VTDDRVTFTRHGGAEVVMMRGEIDLANAMEIGREIVAHTSQARAVLLDLTAVSFLDSAGVRLLDALVGDLSDRGKPVKLVVGERGPARMTLQLCSFREDLLAVDLEQAAADLGG